jgi:sarcosine oxidase subunit alpha
MVVYRWRLHASCAVYKMGYNHRLSTMPRSVSAQAEKPMIDLTVNGRLVSVPAGSTVAAVLFQADISIHKSVSGELRGPLCAMGICMECCANVNGIPHVKTCQVVVRPDMKVITE